MKEKRQKDFTFCDSSVKELLNDTVDVDIEEV